MLQAIKDTVGFVKWAFGLVKGWLSVRWTAGESETHSVEAVELSRDRVRFYRETHKKHRT